jgi:hypothetical protein
LIEFILFIIRVSLFSTETEMNRINFYYKVIKSDGSVGSPGKHFSFFLGGVGQFSEENPWVLKDSRTPILYGIYAKKVNFYGLICANFSDIELINKNFHLSRPCFWRFGAESGVRF